MSIQKKTETKFEYEGSELELFESAKNWREYWSSRITDHLGDSVLEVGAGIGSVTKLLSAKTNSWSALEPDSAMAHKLKLTQLPVQTKVVCGTTETLAKHEAYETILYIDVLEHIENDALELERASSMLKKGGRLVVLSPAHNWLMSEFDRRIGHYRRYSRASLRKLKPLEMTQISSEYLDSIGLIASFANRFFLRQSEPTKAQIMFWDTYMVKFSKLLDPLFGFNVGKTLVMVWVKD